MVTPARTVVEQFIKGWEGLDHNKIVETISEENTVLIWGTDADEVWRSRTQFALAVDEQISAFDQPRYTWAPGDPLEFVESSSGVVAGTLRVEFVVDQSPVQVEMRSTFFVQEQQGEWRIAHAHFSTAEPGRVVNY